jgi:hypothetical protein
MLLTSTPGVRPCCCAVHWLVDAEAGPDGHEQGFARQAGKCARAASSPLAWAEVNSCHASMHAGCVQDANIGATNITVRSTAGITRGMWVSVC